MRIPYLLLSTIILFFSNLIVRILGFLYKIILSKTIGEYGLGIYHIVFNLLMICLSLTTTSIPVTLSSLIAKKNSINDKKNINLIFISALYSSLLISFFISFLLYINSEKLSLEFLHDKNLKLFIIAICPAVIVSTLSNILRAYFYGVKKITIPAISQVLEQISRIAFFIFLVSFIKEDNLKCYIALLGISFGEIINILYLVFSLYKNSNIYNKYSINIKDFLDSSFETIKISIPLTCSRISNILLHSISSLIVPSCLVLSGINYQQSISMYGIISGMVMPLIYLPFTVGSALVVNLIPSISQEIELKKYSRLKTKINYSIILTLFVGVLSSIMFYFFSREICLMVFDNIVASRYLKAMFLVPIFISLNQTLSSILHSIGKEVLCGIISIISVIIQIICIYTLVPIPNINIYGYIYSLSIVSMVTSFIYMFFVYNSIKKYEY